MLISLWNGIHIPDISVGLCRTFRSSHQPVNSFLLEMCCGIEEQSVLGCGQQMLVWRGVPFKNETKLEAADGTNSRNPWGEREGALVSNP